MLKLSAAFAVRPGRETDSEFLSELSKTHPKQEGESNKSTPPLFGLTKDSLENELAGKDNLVIKKLSVAPGGVKNYDCFFEINGYTGAK